ncbi:MAG: hypothetical protein L0Y44_15255 [Phycisphaerales bacterium]|nr:hypothetical protein [Phycisphaerales bacterium]MCI0632001.1 hypothetical protein [Phycisphaerales bacterium]
MNQRFEHNSIPNPLPDDFSEAERSIDERLADLAHRAPVRIGLSQRVLQASARMVPQQPLRLAGRSRSTVSRWTFGHLLGPRLSLAASVLIVCGLAAWFLHRPLQHGGEVADSGLHTDIDFITLHVPQDSTDRLESKWSDLLDTYDASQEDVEDELVMLVSKLDT